MKPIQIKNEHLHIVDGDITLRRNGEVLRFKAQQLPDEFIEWQRQARLMILEQITQGKHPITFGAHLPVVATMSENKPFLINTANKGVGFVPKPSVLQKYTQQYENCLARSKTRPVEESRAERIEVVKNFYLNEEDVDRRCFGLLEIFTGKTFQNILNNPFVTLHFTDTGPFYRSYQIDCIAEIILPDCLYYRFIYASRQLFEQERFHIQQPSYPFGYLFWVQQVYEKTPRQKIAGRILVQSQDNKMQLREFECKTNRVPRISHRNTQSTFEKILVPVDNSPRANMAMKTAIAIARQFHSEVVGIHVYAARLHDRRFVEMEDGLPEKYQQPEVLQKQRDIHDSLITKGLEIISDSYLEVIEQKCREYGVDFTGQQVEGKNYKELVRTLHQKHYDLVVLGATGLGENGKDVIGSVCLRLVRRTNTDCLIIKNEHSINTRIVVAIDGSPYSFGGMKTALALGKKSSLPVEAVAAFDPNFHVLAFRSLEGVLSEEAGKVFRFKEQERLHNEIIDKGIAKIYQDHLETARKIAVEEGVQIETKLLSGKPHWAILDYLHKRPASLLVVGRIGIHADEELDLGSTTENLLRLAPCNVLIAAGVYSPEDKAQSHRGKDMKILWNEEALKRLQNIPEFARPMAKSAIENYARSHGYKRVTVKAMNEAREKFGM